MQISSSFRVKLTYYVCNEMSSGLSMLSICSDLVVRNALAQYLCVLSQTVLGALGSIIYYRTPRAWLLEPLISMPILVPL